MTLVFDVPPGAREALVAALLLRKGQHWSNGPAQLRKASEQGRRLHYRQNLEIKHARVQWEPFEHSNPATGEILEPAYGRVDIHPYGLDSNWPARAWAADLLALLQRYAIPGSFEATRLDVTVDYFSQRPMSPVLLPVLRTSRKVHVDWPQAPTLSPFALNTRHGSGSSARLVRDYDKFIERHDAGEPPAPGSACIHRSEAVIRPKRLVRSGVKLSTAPQNLVASMPNPFRGHALIHLGLVQGLRDRYLLFAARLMGERNVRDLLEKGLPRGDRPTLRREFQELLDKWIAATAALIPQPHAFFEEHRAELQHRLEFILEGPDAVAAARYADVLPTGATP